LKYWSSLPLLVLFLVLDQVTWGSFRVFMAQDSNLGSCVECRKSGAVMARIYNYSLSQETVTLCSFVSYTSLLVVNPFWIDAGKSVSNPSSSWLSLHPTPHFLNQQESRLQCHQNVIANSPYRPQNKYVYYTYIKVRLKGKFVPVLN
jgi:nitrate/TMAO reductase-like tetraheme cytochrome c subunit